MLSDVAHLEVLIRRARVGLHQQVSRPGLFLPLGNSNNLAVHPADYLYGIVHDIL